MDDAGACTLILRRLLPDVCSYCVSRSSPVSFDRKRSLVACRHLSIAFFLLNFWGLAILKKLNTETH